MNAKQVLNAVFAQSSIKEIEYNNAWSNGTGYFDFAVKGENAPTLKVGEMCKSQTPFGRKIVMVGTNYGNVVVFGRYDDEDSSIVVCNVGSGFDTEKQYHGSLSDEKVAKLLNYTITVQEKAEPAPQPAKVVVTVPSSEGFDWAGAAKTTGIFVGGAAVGAVGKLAWDHFFG